MVDYGKQLVESNELIKKDFNIDRDSIPLDERKIIYIFNELIEERSFGFKDLQKRSNPDNLIYKYKTERISPKDFGSYQNPTELFKDLRDGTINLNEVLKDQINFKSDLSEIKKKIQNQNQKIK